MILPPGVLLVDKPVGPTSHDVVSHVRRVARLRRVGHAGTLDPFASGLLLLLLGQATRLSEYFLPLDKAYEATALLGIETSTHDPEGEVVREDPGWTSLSSEEVEEALVGFSGAILQEPPLYSSKKVRGEAAHRRVRRGEKVSLAAAAVTIHEISLLEFTPPEVRFQIRCSSGTYIRALGRDLGRTLGVGAHLTALVRTGIGTLGVDFAAPLEALRDPETVGERRISPARALSHLPSVEVNASEGKRIRQGQFLPVEGETLPEGEPVRILLGGELLAVGAREGNDLRPRKVLVHD